MRKIWFATCAAAVTAAGCAGSNGPGLTGGMAATGAATPASEVQPASWAERITAPLKKNPLAGLLSDSGDNPTQPAAPPTDFPFDPKKATPELYISLAQMSHRAGNVEQARQHYQKALSIDPQNLDALLGAARMEDREGRLDVAMALYKRAAAAHPRSATAVNDLALCHARQGDLPTAQQLLEQAIRLEPRKALYRNNASKVLVELNQLQGAMAHLSAAHPPAIAHYNMGVLLSERGRDGEAAHYLSQAVAIDPGLEPAQALLAQKMTPAAPAEGGERSIVQTSAQPEPNAGGGPILPTHEVVATVPWSASGGDLAEGADGGAQSGAMSTEVLTLLPPVQ